jgi:hypothetical protein
MAAVPAVPPPEPTGNHLADNFARALFEAHQVREGLSTDPLQRFVTVGELAAANLATAKVIARTSSISVPVTVAPPPNVNPGGGSITYDIPDLGQNDLTQPPNPLDVKARGVGPLNVMLTWNIPVYTNPYYTEVYRTSVNTIGTLTGSFTQSRVFNQASNNTAYYRGRSFGNSFLDILPAGDTGATWYYWVRFITAALVPGNLSTPGTPATKTIDPDKYLTDFQGVTPLLVDASGNVAVRGDLVVRGLITANDISVRGLLTANEVWVKSLVGINATFDSIIGTRIIAGPRYVSDGGGGRVIDPADAPTSGTSGQWRVALGNPLSGFNVGSDGKVRVIHYYKPTYSGGVEAAVVPAANEAFFLDVQGNVFVGGNLTIRTQGSPGAAINGVMSGFGFNGAGVNNASYYRDDGTGALTDYASTYNRFAIWVGRKSDYLSSGAQESNGIFWIREGVNATGQAAAGFNAKLFLGGSPFSQPSMIGFTTNPGAIPDRVGGWIRARTHVTDVLSADSFDATTYFNAAGVEQFPPQVIMINAQLVSYEAESTNGGQSKMALITAEVVNVLSTTVVVALVQQIYLDDWTPEAAPIALMGTVQLPTGTYKIRLRMIRLDDRDMSFLAGWRAIVFGSVGSGDYNLIANGSIIGKDWPQPIPLMDQGYYENPNGTSGTGFGGGGGGGGTTPSGTANFPPDLPP